MSKINTKELCKQIKSAKRNLIWSVKNDIHYISNRHWMVRYKELPRDVLITLFGVFAEIPQNGDTFTAGHSGIHKDGNVNCEQTYKDIEQRSLSKGFVTNFLKTKGKDLVLRVINFQTSFAMVDDSYIRLVEDFSGSEVKGGGVFHPMLCCDGDLILLPVREGNTHENQLLHELIPA